MGFWSELIFGERERKPILVNIPTKIVFATETLLFLRNSHSYEKQRFDDIVSIALNDYLNKHLSAKFDDDDEDEDDNVVQFTPPPHPSTVNRQVYTRGRAQSR